MADFLLAFLTFDPRFHSWLTAAEDDILGFNAFYRWFGADVTARKDLLLPFVAFYRWFCARGVTVGANPWVLFLVFDRLHTPVTVEADIWSSLIVFCNWFCKRATAEVDFLGSCRKYTLSLISSYVSCWRSTEIFCYFSSSIFNMILWASPATLPGSVRRLGAHRLLLYELQIHLIMWWKLKRLFRLALLIWSWSWFFSCCCICFLGSSYYCFLS